MEEGETVTILSRKEMRKQKLMEYLAAKGKLKQPNPRPYLRDDCHIKKPATSALKIIKEKENTAPADKVKNECTEIPNPTSQATQKPNRGTFGVIYKVNVKGSILNGRQNTYSSSTRVPAQPKPNRPPSLIGMYTATSSKSNFNSVSHQKKKPNTGMLTSNRTYSNVAGTAAAKPNSRLSSKSSAALLRPVRTASVRMSLGPVVQTKTGLIPAVTQPRHSLSQTSTHSSALSAAISTITAISGGNKMRSCSSSVSTSQRKTPPINAPKTSVKEQTSLTSTVRATLKVQDQNRANAKPLVGKESQSYFQNQPSALKTMSISSGSTAAANKSEGRAGMPKLNKLNCQPADIFSQKQSDVEGKKTGQPCKVTSRTSSGPASRCSSRPASKVMRPALNELEKKSKSCKETDGKKGHNAVNAPETKADIRKTGAPVVSQTAPQPVRAISFTGQARKTPKIPVRVIPQTEGKKLTAVQEERMRKLQEWREARGISYKRPPMPVRPQVRRTVAVPQPFWATMTEEDEAHSLISAVDRSLADCIKLLGKGCPSDQVKEVLSKLPAVSHKFAKYWICQARLMEQEGNLDVLPMFEKAVGLVLEPVDELRTVVFEILKKRDETQEKEDQISAGESTPETDNNPMMTPKPVRALICGEKGDSSVVKYKITATPGGPPSQKKEPARVNGQEVRFFTPVRRSVRIERASLRYPTSLQDHDLCVASYNDLISEEENERSEEQKNGESSPSADKTPMYVYRQNEALKDKVVVQLVCDEDV
ncbi:cytoskeleton-associated protein 2-like [Cheilinus undulatus]|uniref:cytoskeleton-associated protein 2-like n=1 Tax=Cheilinus undulatus TaxID=241271 RepID=UPI001BD506F3|nr:cytoskeleton-associated protein 2-like [Cheilinus undulatus]